MVPVFAMMLTAAALPEQVTGSPDWALESYGTAIVFDVSRKGKKIGEHSVQIEKDGAGYRVTSETNMKIKFLFFTAYKFKYSATETWGTDGLRQIEAYSKDGDKEASFLKDLDAPSAILPSNHWNPDILNRNSVFNTLTGNPNQITITAEDYETVQTGTGPRRARKYSYSGDLQDVFAWYDDQNRWVGLAFKARDGSMITYTCKACGT